MVEEWIEAIKKYFVFHVKGFDLNQMVVATMLYEGPAD